MKGGTGRKGDHKEDPDLKGGENETIWFNFNSIKCSFHARFWLNLNS